MLTWQLDRFLRSGPLCALATALIPTVLAVIMNAVSDVENVLGILLVGSLIIFVGSATGSVVASGFGVLLFCLGAVLAEVSPFLLLVVGVALFATLIVHDLAGVFRRAPTINAAIWRNAAAVTAGVTVASACAFAVTYWVASLATWKSIVVPFGIAAVGFAAKLAADSHVVQARRLTAKRRDPDS